MLTELFIALKNHKKQNATQSGGVFYRFFDNNPRVCYTTPNITSSHKEGVPS